MTRKWDTKICDVRTFLTHWWEHIWCGCLWYRWALHYPPSQHSSDACSHWPCTGTVASGCKWPVLGTQTIIPAYICTQWHWHYHGCQGNVWRNGLVPEKTAKQYSMQVQALYCGSLSAVQPHTSGKIEMASNMLPSPALCRQMLVAAFPVSLQLWDSFQTWDLSLTAGSLLDACLQESVLQFPENVPLLQMSTVTSRYLTVHDQVF